MTAFSDYQSKAQEQTRAAQEQLSALSRILTDSLVVEHKLKWDELKDRSPFPQPKPNKPALEQPPFAEPQRDYFQKPLTFLEKLIPPLRKKQERRVDCAFHNAHGWWEQKIKEIDQRYGEQIKKYQHEMVAWEQACQEFQQKQHRQQAKIDAQEAAYLAQNPAAVLQYCKEVLAKSQYPATFPKSCMLEYLLDSKTVVTEYELPHVSALPTVKEVKYIASRNELRHTHVSDAWLARTYDDVLYQIALRTMWELFESDTVNAIDSIVFNGWVDTIDKATGKEFRACVLSVQSSKAEFLDITLAKVDPKSCFKKLKGISGSRLAEVMPIRPILQISREDKRFVPGYAVVDSLDRGTNLAAMDWLDFENLIRELFQEEFSKNGGEVKITQASRDGGVDAIAFDPDPIRGGKIVIQAKRYTNTVSVSAVRDLYGTVVNEGATKGILVTTADYGRDAYEFAKDKPITLLSGSELLHLLSHHGHRARIDLAEARKVERERSKGMNTFGPSSGSSELE
jgi:restriction system protein